MADHNAHTYFGLRVLEQLPADLRTHVSGDMPAFHLGLYGPDPLILSLLTKHISDRLHKNWRTESLPGLSKALQKGSATARSFAGGYVLHQLLDDTVHPQIYQWMEEGSSHFRLEIALDLLLLEEKRQANSPKVRTEGKDRTALAAAGMLAPLGARAYLSGLWRMATLSNVFCGPGRPMSAGVRAKEKVQAKELRDRMEAQIAPAARELEKILVQIPSQTDSPRQELLLSRTGRRPAGQQRLADLRRMPAAE